MHHLKVRSYSSFLALVRFTGPYVLFSIKKEAKFTQKAFHKDKIKVDNSTIKYLKESPTRCLQYASFNKDSRSHHFLVAKTCHHGWASKYWFLILLIVPIYFNTRVESLKGFKDQYWVVRFMLLLMDSTYSLYYIMIFKLPWRSWCNIKFRQDIPFHTHIFTKILT